MKAVSGKGHLAVLSDRWATKPPAGIALLEL